MFSIRAAAPVEGILQQRAQRAALDRTRIPIRIRDGEVGGPVQVGHAHADVGQRQRRAHGARKGVHAARRVLGAECARDPAHRLGAAAVL